jgi:prophage regulatory protein
MHLYRLERAGLFPKRLRLGPNSVGWLEEELDEWIRVRAENREGIATRSSAA